ncbi:sterol desaturase family protein [Emticicia sp. 17c]|uniref:sterol desaturase family protein n=1 Tax=Emticicia sp. 17c TaxID=3127704 RepID=UPI00301E0DB1
MMSLIDFLSKALKEIIDFFRIGGLLDIIHSGNYRILLTLEGFLSFLAPLAPLLILLEVIWLLVLRRFNEETYRVPFMIILINRVLSRVVGVSVILICINVFSKYALFHVSLKWYWFIYGYLVYELNTFIRHYLSHKVRLLWCFHSVHHAPESLNASITLNTSYVENIYTEFFTATFCTLLGVPPIMLFTIMIIDSIWGAFAHISENSLKNARLGFLEKIILTPSHHRVHHGRNFLYMDTNFCSIINIWDKLFHTYQEEEEAVPVEYGITREVNANKIIDVYFGEFGELWHDIKSASGFKNKLLYIFMPPGWSPDGEDLTAKTLRNNFIVEMKSKA